MSPSAAPETPRYASTGSVLNTAIDGSKPIRLHEVPTFSDKHEERLWAKEHMAGAFRIFAKLGYADGASGHISLRDPVRPDCFWINPYAVHFSTITVADLVLVDEQGTPVEPTKHKVNAAGFIIHSSIHKARPDVNAACHLHAPHSRAWSTFGLPIEMINQDSCMFFDDLAVYEGFGGIVLARDEGLRIAEALGPVKKNVILQNHGILTCGETMGEAAAFFIALERACQAQLLVEAAAASGIKKRYVGDEEAKYTKECSGSPACMYMQFLPEYNAVVQETKGSFLA
ncbi:class II aldolase/adducin N-terminal [Plectosphaerella cucumerina]|uniref:Class II aldolase/adducin N-terminal n=1 Tax=Plectosphaerella cucumerina TaxID=40658 RepID=A0A8K0TAE1_9PEZI|nr:class II aldolase/adducin N-terminal [Plectosphaerella cucumerina]